MIKLARNGLLVALCLLLLVGQGYATTGPMDKVKSTVNLVIEILKNSELDREAKRAELSNRIQGAFDFTSMSQRILARNWRKASQQEQQKFVGLLTELLKNSYIGNIENYTDEEVAFVKERIKKNKAAIDTLIVTSSKEIPVSYRLQQRGEDWKVYDVVVESVSFVNSYRDSYGEIVKRDGIAGLLSKMEHKLAQLVEENQGQ